MNYSLLLVLLVVTYVTANVQTDRIDSSITSKKSEADPKKGWLKEATWIMRYAGIAYCNEPDIKTWKCPYCNDDYTKTGTIVKTFTDALTQSQAFLAVDTSRQTIFLSFRGTIPTSIRSVAVDLMTWPVEYTPTPTRRVLVETNANVNSRIKVRGRTSSKIASRMGVNSRLAAFKAARDYLINPQLVEIESRFQSKDETMMVHAGFLAAWNSIKTEVIDSITKTEAKYPSYRIIVTGHSLGGALAMLGGLQVYEALYPPSTKKKSKMQVISFGQPRVGNAAFVERFQSVFPDYYRINSGNDPVPHLPPQMLGFVHSKTEVWYPYGGTTDAMTCSGEDEVSTCSSSITQNGLLEFIFSASVSDHLRYLDWGIADCRFLSLLPRFQHKLQKLKNQLTKQQQHQRLSTMSHAQVLSELYAKRTELESMTPENSSPAAMIAAGAVSGLIDMAEKQVNDNQIRRGTFEIPKVLDAK